MELLGARASPLCSSTAPSRGLLFSCTQHLIKASRDHRAISSPIPAPGENLNPAALGCAGAGWELWAVAWVGGAHPKPPQFSCCVSFPVHPVGFLVPEHILAHMDTTNQSGTQ